MLSSPSPTPSSSWRGDWGPDDDGSTVRAGWVSVTDVKPSYWYNVRHRFSWRDGVPSDGVEGPEEVRLFVTEGPSIDEPRTIVLPDVVDQSLHRQSTRCPPHTISTNLILTFSLRFAQDGNQIHLSFPRFGAFSSITTENAG